MNAYCCICPSFCLRHRWGALDVVYIHHDHFGYIMLSRVDNQLIQALARTLFTVGTDSEFGEESWQLTRRYQTVRYLLYETVTSSTL